MTKLEWITDSGHGWLAISGDGAALARRCSTGYDYASHDGETVYLEEDMSVRVFVRNGGATIDEVREAPDHYMNGYCFVRDLPRLRAGDLGSLALAN